MTLDLVVDGAILALLLSFAVWTIFRKSDTAQCDRNCENCANTQDIKKND